MKKANIFLIAIAVLAVVGGALAFKAKRTPFLAYTIIGQTTTSFIINNCTYRTVIPYCTWAGVFIDPNSPPTTITISDLFKPITAYCLLNGIIYSATTLEFVCAPTIAATTAEF
jgi:hypothetical protein